MCGSDSRVIHNATAQPGSSRAAADLFSPLLVTLRQAFEVNSRVAGRQVAVLGCLTLLGLLGDPRAPWAAVPTCTDPVPRPASAAALQPSDVLLSTLRSARGAQ